MSCAASSAACFSAGLLQCRALLAGPGNPISYLALLLVVPGAFFLFWRYPARKAALITMFGGAMFLPCVVGFNLPVFPDFDKEILPGLGALFACIVLRRRALRSPPFGGPEALLIVAMLGVLGTVMTNGDPLSYGPTLLPAQTLYDGFVDSIGIVMKWLPPYYLGRAMFRTRADLLQLCRFIVLAGLLYSIPIMLELRLSPQLHNWIYGFHQSDFIQTIRWGGYRPKVFMRHGLNVALFMMITVLMAMALWKGKVRLGSKRWLTSGRAFAFLLVILLLCKSTGAYFYLALLMPLIYFAPLRIQRLGIVGFVIFILGYPMIRSAGLIPVDDLIDWMTEQVGEERANSLWFRFFTEEQVLENARERFVFGWGGYGRPYKFDVVTGEQLSILDGYWVIEIGSHGLVGFFCIFGMMLWPAVQVARKIQRIKNKSDRLLLVTLALSVVIYVFDWVPNSSISAELTFMTGALAGLMPGMLAEQRKNKRARQKAQMTERRESLQPPVPRTAQAR